MKTKITTLLLMLTIALTAQTDSIEDRFIELENKIDLNQKQEKRKIDAINLRLQKAYDNQVASKILIATGILVSSFGYIGTETSVPIIVFGGLLSTTGIILDIRSWTFIKPK
jgi:hypothetical protein